MSTRPAAGRFLFRDAAAGDDATLRAILRATPLPGWVTLSYEREPDYFAGCAIEGDSRTVLAETAAGEAVGFFSRAVRRAWIGGEAVRLGYLGQLRLLPQWRRRSRVVLRGFDVCRQLLDDGRQDTPYYLTSVLADNLIARRFLTANIRGMPTYRPLCGFVTRAVATRQPYARRRPMPPYALRPATPGDVETLASLLLSSGRCHELHPVWDVAALTALAPVGWRPEHCLIVERAGRGVACGCRWDQRGLRQWRVDAYSPALSGLRPLANTGLRLAGYPTLPVPGSVLAQGFLSHLAVAPGEEPVLPWLVAGLLREAHAAGLASVVFGLPDPHPWVDRLVGLRALRYRSDLFLVHWPKGRPAAEAVDGRRVHIEAACL
jgi:hypothetical protein